MGALIGVPLFLLVAHAVRRSSGSLPVRSTVVGVGLAVVVSWALLRAPGVGGISCSIADYLHDLVGHADASTPVIWGHLADPQPVQPAADVLEQKPEHPEAPPDSDSTTLKRPQSPEPLIVGLPPKIIFLSMLIACLRRYGVIDVFVRVCSALSRRTFGPSISGIEAAAASANVVVGQTDVPLLLRAQLRRMSSDQLLLLMSAGFATVSVAMLPVYDSLVVIDSGDPGLVMRHVLISNIISAIFVIALYRLMCPGASKLQLRDHQQDGLANDNNASSERPGLLDVLVTGASDGLKLAVAIIVMLVGFSAIGDVLRPCIDSAAAAAVMAPTAWLAGVPWCDASCCGRILLEQIMLTEIVAYKSLGESVVNGEVDPRSALVCVHIICGFASIPSIAVQVGTLQALCPERRAEYLALAPRAIALGFLACWCSAGTVSLVLPENLI